MKHSTHHLLAALLSGLFGLFLTYNSLTSSDFPRGLYGPPNSTHWDDFSQLNPNRVWNYNWGGNASLNAYLTACSTHGIKACLRLDPVYSGEFNIFYMEYYSCGQHHIYQAEIDYDSSAGIMLGTRPDIFYFFVHSDSSTHPVRGELAPNVPEGGASWRCTKDASYGAGFMLNGPNETLEGEDDIGTWGNQNRVSTADSQFCAIIRVMADLTELPATDTVFCWRIFKSSGITGITLNSAYYTVASFGGVSSPQWKQFELEYTIPKGGMNLMYTVDWKNKCNFWVDWIEFYDMNRGRYLFTDSTTRANTLALIAHQCDSLEGIYDSTLAAWKQSDEPWRSQFEAHGVVNLMARDELNFPSVTPFAQLTSAGGGSTAWFLRRPELFALLGRPAANYPAH